LLEYRDGFLYEPLWDEYNPAEPDEDQRQALLDAIDLIPEVERVIMLLRLEGLTQAEIGERIGVAHNTISFRESRARARLKWYFSRPKRPSSWDRDLARLTVRQREVVELLDDGTRTLTDVARATRRSQPSVSLLYARALQRLDGTESYARVASLRGDKFGFLKRVLSAKKLNRLQLGDNRVNDDDRDTDLLPPAPHKNGGHHTDVVSDIAEIKRRLTLVEANGDLTLNYVREIAKVLGVISRIEAIEEELRLRAEDAKQ
jgi:DNA-directed RNA polymerase specialized sigma24 family protein